MPEIKHRVQFPNLTQFAEVGVYFLYHEGAIVYVGQAVDVRRRIGQHISDGLKVFDGVGFLPCSVDRLATLERRYIERFLPKYNRCGLARSARSTRPDRALHQASPVIRTGFNKAQAAALLGLSVEQVAAAGLKKRRAPRRKTQFYHYDDLRSFAEANGIAI